jgi:hypothetical protein
MKSSQALVGMGWLGASLVSLGCSASANPDDKDNAQGAAAGSSGGGELAGGSGGAGGTSSTGGSLGDGGSATAGTSSTGGSAGTTSGGSGPGTPVASCGDALADPAPSSAWVNATGNLANMAAGCGTLGKVIAQPCSKTVFASVAGKGLWSSPDGGTTWTQLGTGPGSDEVLNHAFSLFFDPEYHDVLWEAGLHAAGGVFTSVDAGVTMTQLGTMMEAQHVGVDFSDPDRKTLLVGIHGGHQQLHKSTDKGVNWTNIGTNLPAETNASETPVVIDENTYIVGMCGGEEPGWGFYRTTDGGTTWAKKAPYQAGHFGQPLWASDSSIYWPLNYNAGLAKSSDLGETWVNLVEGNVIMGITPIELPDGSIAAIGVDHVVRSTDGGESWTPVGEALPFSLSGQNGNVTYSTLEKKFYVAHWDCGDSVASDAIMSAGWDWEAP